MSKSPSSIGSNYINRHFYGIDIYIIHKIHTNVSNFFQECAIYMAYLKVVFGGKETQLGYLHKL